jgi:PTS system nitrogen regulatory IIA component
MKLTIEQIATALDLPRSKIERWIRQGRIPLNRRGDECTFNRQGLERWARQHHLRLAIERGGAKPGGRPAAESLLAALAQGGIHYDIEGQTVPDVMESTVARLTVVAPETKPDLVAKLIERESLNSTGLGNGIAVPHPREPESLLIQSPSIAAGFLKHPVDFNALDGKPVMLLFVLLSPSVRTHLQLLSRLSYGLRDRAFVSFLQRTPKPDALLKKVADLEAQSENTSRSSV